MRVVGVGNLILDYYFFDNEIYVNGGGSVSNILANIAAMGVDTKILGYYGDDYIGKIAKELLENSGVDTSLLEKKSYQTKCFFIDSKGTTSSCPYCGKKRKNYVLCENIKEYVEDDDIILIQDYVLINNIANRICLDFGYFKKLIYIDKEMVERFIFRKYYIVNIKEEALFFILSRLGMTFEEFKERIDIYFLIITRGKKGATVVYENKEYSYEPVPFGEKEANGCGDVFFATFIREVGERESLTENDIGEIYEMAQKNVFVVINNIGARNHIVENKRIVGKKGKCICEEFEIG